MKILGTVVFVCALVLTLRGQGDWPAYAYNQSGQRYSPLAQITVKNVSNLKLAWQYGVTVEELTQEDVRDPSLRPVLLNGGGLLVTDVSPDGPAYNRLFPQGSPLGPDIILKVNGTPVRTREDFRTALRTVHSGDIATLIAFTPGNQNQPGQQKVVRLLMP